MLKIRKSEVRLVKYLYTLKGAQNQIILLILNSDDGIVIFWNFCTIQACAFIELQWYIQYEHTYYLLVFSLSCGIHVVQWNPSLLEIIISLLISDAELLRILNYIIDSACGSIQSCQSCQPISENGGGWIQATRRGKTLLLLRVFGRGIL